MVFVLVHAVQLRSSNRVDDLLREVSNLGVLDLGPASHQALEQLVLLLGAFAAVVHQMIELNRQLVLFVAKPVAECVARVQIEHNTINVSHLVLLYDARQVAERGFLVHEYFDLLLALGLDFSPQPQDYRHGGVEVLLVLVPDCAHDDRVHILQRLDHLESMQYSFTDLGLDHGVQHHLRLRDHVHEQESEQLLLLDVLLVRQVNWTEQNAPGPVLKQCPVGFHS